MSKNMIYFRGKCYIDSRYNRYVARFLTFLYKLRIEFLYYVETFWWKILLFFLLVFVLVACSSSSAQLPHFFNTYEDVYVSDTMLYKDHSFIVVKTAYTNQFQVLHSPDCFCRFNRKFIIIKHSK